MIGYVEYAADKFSAVAIDTIINNSILVICTLAFRINLPCRVSSAIKTKTEKSYTTKQQCIFLSTMRFIKNNISSEVRNLK